MFLLRAGFAVVLDVGVLLLQVVGCVERRVGRDEGHVEEEGPLLVALLDPAGRLVGEQEGLVALVVDGLAVALEVLAALVREGREVAHLGVEVAVEVIEAALLGW